MYALIRITVHLRTVHTLAFLVYYSGWDAIQCDSVYSGKWQTEIVDSSAPSIFMTLLPQLILLSTYWHTYWSFFALTTE